jgi:hypothetical protein
MFSIIDIPSQVSSQHFFQQTQILNFCKLFVKVDPSIEHEHIQPAHAAYSLLYRGEGLGLVLDVSLEGDHLSGPPGQTLSLSLGQSIFISGYQH